ncbi:MULTISPECIES: hypothetical protein [unclassified Nocardioides]|uniref:hypothetical protein n=1 Tax=unclassified Nocardioides TaxID=2615069 RepID=UPI00070360F6|nr:MULTISPECIES: hypothetical protein [unclassified Nocardioides]KRC57051.1 hypothetical protein ASE19_03390 [Nocardioides sp. Root79]KRC77280.1 hypothetical protein ASE20_02255 [Nocardioides sp. Root240]
MSGRDHLSKGEIAKDAIQAGAEAAATTVGEVATILTKAVGDVAAAVGGFATEVFEIRDSSRRALAEHGEEKAVEAPAIDEIDPA